jgi:co-chaperonin GroES (HSP10)
MIECTRDNLLVAEMKGKEKKESKSEGGIILSAQSDTTKPGSVPGYVINVGPDVKYIKPKDIIYVDWSKGLVIDIDDESQGVIIPLEAVKAVSNG